jgi:hypothetical protein
MRGRATKGGNEKNGQRGGREEEEGIKRKERGRRGMAIRHRGTFTIERGGGGEH